jgi:LCP family protein required for cell wall assembly
VTTAQKIVLGFLSVIACALLGVVGYLGLQTYQFYASQPLGPALPQAAFTPLSLPPTWTPTPGEPFAATTLAPTKIFPTSTPQQPLCGGPAVMTILAIGTDQRSDSYIYGLADVIRVVRVDFITPKVSVLEFSRDLWVEIPYISDNINGQDHEKLNQAYLYGNPGDGFAYWDDPSQGPGLLSLTMSLNFGVNADHYVAVNMRTFENIVDAVGGIDVNIPDLDMAYNTGLTVGDHHLGGPQALKVARNREEGVFARVTNQNLVLCALRDKLVNPKVVTQVPGLIDSFKDNIQTDFTPEQLGQLACLGTKLPLDNITFVSFPQDLFKETRVYDPVFKKNVFIWDVDFNILRDYVARFNAGLWPGLSTTAALEEGTTSTCP